MDELDRKLIDALRPDGRKTSKALAADLGIAETTVAARLRQMREDRVMQVVLRRDLYSKGFDLQCLADVHVSGRPVVAVARDLARIDVVSSVSLMLGSPEIVAVFNARDRRDLLRVLDEDIAPIKGVARIEIHTTLDIRKYQVGYTSLPRT